MVADRQTYDRARFVQDFGGVDSFEGVALKPSHFAVALALQPIFKLARGFGSFGGGDAAIVETQFTRARFDSFFHWPFCARRN